MKKYARNIIKELQNRKKDLITIDMDDFDSSKKFEEETVFRIEKKNREEEFLADLAVYLFDDMIGIVADDKYAVADICSKASDIEYEPGETYARYLGIYTGNNSVRYHIAQIIDNNEQKEINWKKVEKVDCIARLDFQTRDHVRLLNLIYECAANNQSADELLKIVKENKLNRLR